MGSVGCSATVPQQFTTYKRDLPREADTKRWHHDREGHYTDGNGVVDAMILSSSFVWSIVSSCRSLAKRTAKVPRAKDGNGRFRTRREGNALV